MKKLLVVFGLLFLPQTIYAHPGKTAADGCHYCRTNCAKWGEVEGARHCHGGTPAVAQPTVSKPATISTPKPTLKPTTPKPTAKPTIKPTPRPTTTPRPTATPKPTTSPTPAPEISPEPTIEPAQEVQSTPVTNPAPTKPAWNFWKWLFGR